MRIPRIYTADEQLQVGTMVTLDREASNHLSRVLRLRVGSEVVLFNGDGHDYQGKIEAIERNQVQVHLLQAQEINVESPLYIHLYQGVSRGDKMDLTLQKGVELGIKEFTPIITERCGVKLDEKRWAKKIQHWEKVIISACEQCGRNQIPKLNPVTPLSEAISKRSGQDFFLHPDAETQFKSYGAVNFEQSISLWVGPEGGFSEPEVDEVTRNDITPVALGPRVLRTETAALAAVSVINSVWGDF
ncbi:16S rRNA (uracil(1498)-N(3))-methyltransferase [Kangiella japonica]|uniref:Ribosomal RNA small subunit methyltransferase E n=1 Tax=Kangiella japonica TaxID=647384 RepID=A0ABN0T1I3_9GAMM